MENTLEYTNRHVRECALCRSRDWCAGCAIGAIPDKSNDLASCACVLLVAVHFLYSTAGSTMAMTVKSHPANHPHGQPLILDRPHEIIDRTDRTPINIGVCDSNKDGTRPAQHRHRAWRSLNRRFVLSSV